jgi:hypothetical protein
LTTMLENQPGVAAAGFVNNVPLSGNTGKSAATLVGHGFQPRESPRASWTKILHATTGAAKAVWGTSYLWDRQHTPITKRSQLLVW